jgi:FkbM family methyltransferase
MILPRTIDNWIRSTLKRRGYIFMRQTNPYHYLGRRMMLMQNYGIDLVLDVGANRGQYGQRLRGLGYTGEIVSWEPMQKAFAELLKTSEGDDHWNCFAFGLGEADTTTRIHVSENSISSSVLPMLPSHSHHSPTSKVIGEEDIQLRRLDSVFDSNKLNAYKGIWLKLDVQGLEDKVIAGATAMLPSVAAIQVELSLIPLYTGQLTLIPMIELLSDAGFDPVAFEPGFEDKNTGEYLQVDGIFRNRSMRHRVT